MIYSIIIIVRICDKLINDKSGHNSITIGPNGIKITPKDAEFVGASD